MDFTRLLYKISARFCWKISPRSPVFFLNKISGEILSGPKSWIVFSLNKFGVMKNGRHLHFLGGHSKVFGGWKCERVRSTTDLVVAQNEAVFPGGVTLRGGCLISHTWRVWTKHWVDFDKLPTGEFTGFQPYKTVWNSEGSIRKMVVYQESGHFSPTSTLNSARWFPAFRGRGKLSILRKKCQIRRKWKSTNGFHWGKKTHPYLLWILDL